MATANPCQTKLYIRYGSMVIGLKPFVNKHVHDIIDISSRKKQGRSWWDFIWIAKQIENP